LQTADCGLQIAGLLIAGLLIAGLLIGECGLRIVGLSGFLDAVDPLLNLVPNESVSER
jgi:hypothetical protein